MQETRDFYEKLSKKRGKKNQFKIAKSLDLRHFLSLVTIALGWIEPVFTETKCLVPLFLFYDTDCPVYLKEFWD